MLQVGLDGVGVRGGVEESPGIQSGRQHPNQSLFGFVTLEIYRVIQGLYRRYIGVYTGDIKGRVSLALSPGPQCGPRWQVHFLSKRRPAICF